MQTSGSIIIQSSLETALKYLEQNLAVSLPHPDVKIIAGDNKIADIREAIAFMQTTPWQGHRKILIIDCAHNLNVYGQNALLKAIEEPHGQNMWVLVSLYPYKLLATVRSRATLWKLDTSHCNYASYALLQPLFSGKALSANLIANCLKYPYIEVLYSIWELYCAWAQKQEVDSSYWQLLDKITSEIKLAEEGYNLNKELTLKLLLNEIILWQQKMMVSPNSLQ